MKNRFIWTTVIVLCIAAWGYAECNITFTQPISGDPLRLGTVKTIIWQQTSVCGGNILLKLTKNGGWSANIVSVPASNLSYNWSVGSLESGTANAGEGYRIKCVSEETGAQCGESATFKIIEQIVSAANPSANIQPLQPPFQKKELPQFYAIQYDHIEHGDLVLMPETLNIKYGAQTLTLSPAGTGVISIPEDSPLINPNGSVKTTVSYVLKNTTAKNLRFNIMFILGSTLLTSKEIIILSNQTKSVQWNINFPSMPQSETARNLQLKGPIGTSDDTPIFFFLAKLKIYTYAL
jgi:hypothetical protein